MNLPPKRGAPALPVDKPPPRAPTPGQRLSALLLRLHRTARAATRAEFRGELLHCLCEELPFASAAWGFLVRTPEGFTVRGVHRLNRPDAVLENWRRVQHLDQLAQRVFAQPGVTVNSDYDDPEFHPDLRRHIERFDMHHTLCTAVIDPVTQLGQYLSIFRPPAMGRFSEAERALKELAMPHLLEAANAAEIRSVLHSTQDDEAPRPAALCHADGFLHNIEPGFVELLRREYPGWCGPYLPAELAAACSAAGCAGPPPHFVGRHMAASATALPGAAPWLLRARPPEACDALTARERAIAAHYAGGASYKEIARSLSIAPATVRNHLYNIYRKLGVSDKAPLAALLARA